ncbi:MAG: cupin domain-containing protein [Chloroflexi bacterium]|nr:cupin domain-containing protein [Chloroflexota bacterium]
MAIEQAVDSERMESFFRRLEAKGMDALWRQRPGDRTGGAPFPPFRWRWSDIESFVQEATELVRPGPQAERRVVLLGNPHVPGNLGATHTLTAAVQTVLPGEIAPSHRHTAAAIRWVLRGKGTITMVDGEPCEMNPGDLVLTPGWCWHGHINQSDGPMVWMDSLDVPLVGALQAMLQEPYPDELNPATKPVGDSYARYGSGSMRPVWGSTSSPISPLLTFPWSQTERALHQLAKIDASPFDDVAFQFTNPLTGGHVLPTIGCWIQMLRPGVRTQAHRHMTSAVYQVFRGRGSTIIDGVQLDWEEGDFFALPPRAWHEHVNRSTEHEALLFSTNDLPVFEALNLYREEPYADRNGHQDVIGSYEERAG